MELLKSRFDYLIGSSHRANGPDFSICVVAKYEGLGDFGLLRFFLLPRC